VSAPLVFGLPNALGHTHAVQRAFLLEEYFTELLRRPISVRVCATYEELERDLLSGELAAAWAPPLVCARLEARGGQVAAQGIRSGCSAYRAVLVARAGHAPPLDGSRPVRAAWVDRSAISGYVLPRAYLTGRGVQLEELFAGSYAAALEALLQGQVDLSATWASSAQAAAPYAGYRELLGPRAAEVVELGFTRECPNDGVVLSPGLEAGSATALWGAILDLGESPEGQALAQQVFGAERFAPAASGSYQELASWAAELKSSTPA
jgi:phosphonate transport system substrate-binding protein